MNVKITKAKVGDIAGIIKVRRITWLATYPNKRYKISKHLILSMDFTSPAAVEKIESSIKRKDVRIWVAKIKETIVGYGTARKYKDKESNCSNLRSS
jgi:DUF1365 family protein